MNSNDNTQAYTTSNTDIIKHKTVWLHVRSRCYYAHAVTPICRDWQHETSIYRNQQSIARHDDDDDNDNCISILSCYVLGNADADAVGTDSGNTIEVHVLYHFHDNYVDTAMIYTSRVEAEQDVWHRVHEQHSECAVKSAEEKDERIKVVTTITAQFVAGRSLSPVYM